MTSPLIKINGSDRITPIASNSLNASPADKHAVEVMHLTESVDDTLNATSTPVTSPHAKRKKQTAAEILKSSEDQLAGV